MKKVLSSLIAAGFLLSSSVNAELKYIDDEELSNVTGQKGLTIDIDMAIEIGEFMYKDAGSIVMQGVRLGGMDHSDEVGTSYDASVGIVADSADASNGIYGGTTGLNNVRVEVDVAGDGSTPGMVLDLPFIGPTALQDNQFFWAWGKETALGISGATGCGDGNGDKCELTLNDGDLLIHATYSDADANKDGRPHTIGDFGFEMDKFAIKDSSYIAGDDFGNHGGSANSHQETTLYSNIRMEGFYGGFDMLLENKGNGFGTYDSAGNFTETGRGDAASKIIMNTFFEITEMEYDFDIAGIRVEKMEIHNKRGNKDMFDIRTQEEYNSTFIGDSQGYAQSNTQIYAVKDAIIGLQSDGSTGFVDGVAMDSRFQGDMTIGHLSLGDTGVSIGQLHWTDMAIISYQTLSAH